MKGTTKPTAAPAQNPIRHKNIQAQKQVSIDLEYWKTAHIPNAPVNNEITENTVRSITIPYWELIVKMYE